ncbi:peptide deformylase [Inhella proteolytica]|uniref:Peptide deformylase n=1 Tax=Inhella proteolytica TaxID=2795029 RepID=A0A931NH62_9BURK|nr:peptide deformylase [Inhella proteolytica]MBH9577891.1 peptide deformylase [Inhella proteolytica]
MAVREILRMGDSRLLRVAQPVSTFDTPELRALVQDLRDTMLAAGGAGLAAPQIGVDLRVVLFGFEKLARYPEAEPVPETLLINPEIELLGAEEQEGWEGCLSVPGLRGVVARPSYIRYRGRTLEGGWIEREARSFHARVVQHECDHLDGQLYPMKVRDFRRFGFTEVLFPGL